MDEILSTYNWPTNADMIADVAKLGYLDGTVLDATYGEGKFWTKFKPAMLLGNDLYKDTCQFSEDYTTLSSTLGCDRFDTVVFDPDYKMTGTPSTPSMDYAYGTDRPMRYQDRLANIQRGAVECFRVCSKYVLIKCQDQVVSGHVVWQTDLITRKIEDVGGIKVEQFNFLQDPRPQPKGRRQVHARRNYSTLLIFEKS